MRAIRSLSLCLVLVFLTGCATILSGRTQTVTIQTNPPGAACEMTCNGKVIGNVNPTPGAMMVQKTKHPISIVCKKPGYQDATYNVASGSEGATFGNILAGGLIGWGVDSATGADNKYAEVNTITLAPVEVPAKSQPVQEASNNQVVDEKSGVEGRLKHLDELKSKGLLTEKEFKEQKQKVLRDL